MRQIARVLFQVIFHFPCQILSRYHHKKKLLLRQQYQIKADSYHDIVTVADKETGQSLGKGRVQFGVSALEDMLRSQKAKGVLIHRDDWISITPEIQLLFTEF